MVDSMVATPSRHNHVELMWNSCGKTANNMTLTFDMKTGERLDG